MKTVVAVIVWIVVGVPTTMSYCCHCLKSLRLATWFVIDDLNQTMLETISCVLGSVVCWTNLNLMDLAPMGFQSLPLNLADFGRPPNWEGEVNERRVVVALVGLPLLGMCGNFQRLANLEFAMLWIGGNLGRMVLPMCLELVTVLWIVSLFL